MLNWEEPGEAARESSHDGENLRHLLDVSKALCSILDLDCLLEVVMDKVMEITRAERGFLMLHDAKKGLVFRVAKNMEKELIEGDGFRISRSIAEEVFHAGTPLCSTNIPQDERLRNRKSVMELGLESVMCVPLAVKKKKIGIIYVDSHRISSLFTQGHLRVFTALAEHASIAIENARLYEMAVTDEKTGLYNHSFFRRRLEERWEQAFKNDEAYALMMVDIDHFKSVNDQYGHAVGDDVLRGVAAILKGSVRGNDIPARFGGEEFAIILSSDSHKGLGANAGQALLRRSARSLAERLRKAVESKIFRSAGREIRITISLGVAFFPAPDVQKPEDLFMQADMCLYQAKREGRNRVCYPARTE
jgi:diguanylate cyclase (GGDEF)-like protein